MQQNESRLAENNNEFLRHLSTSKQYWQMILDYKSKFLQYDTKNLEDYPQLDPNIFESWLRSYGFGVNPYNNDINQFLDSRIFSSVLKKNTLLIDISQQVYDDLKLKDIMIESKYAFYLFDENAVLLFTDGHKLKFATETKPGEVWSERNIGTCAHVLCLKHKRPVQLIGPEHYCFALHNSCTSAAPVMDENGNVIATLVLSVHLQNPPHDIYYISHTLGLITAMAVCVENKLQLIKSYDQLKTAYYMQKVTMSVIDEGIVAANNMGKILNINKEAASILKINENEIKDKNINDFFGTQTIDYVIKGKSIDIEETILSGNDELPFLINIRPVINDKTGCLDGTVLKFTPIEKINDLVTSRSGATATFTFDDIIGESKVIKKAISLGKRFAMSAENILLTGESGTGKELFAQAIHNAHRPQGSFIAVNCAAMPRELIESELFGYEGGSFTGAERSGRPGKIELAHGGTLFLDEIGDMPLELQAVLLRVLEDKQVMRIGGRRYKKVDFRLIAATNRDLVDMVKEKVFREDLYFRLSILNIKLPSLRERIGDIEILVSYFMGKYCKKIKQNIPQMSPEVKEILKSYNWPGNVRQLENSIIYSVNVAQNDTLEKEDLPGFLINEIQLRCCPNKNTEFEYNIEKIEKILIENALFKTRNNITKAAELLGLAKSTLYRKLKDFNISIDE